MDLESATTQAETKSFSTLPPECIACSALFIGIIIIIAYVYIFYDVFYDVFYPTTTTHQNIKKPATVQ